MRSRPRNSPHSNRSPASSLQADATPWVQQVRAWAQRQDYAERSHSDRAGRHRSRCTTQRAGAAAGPLPTGCVRWHRRRDFAFEVGVGLRPAAGRGPTCWPIPAFGTLVSESGAGHSWAINSRHEPAHRLVQRHRGRHAVSSGSCCRTAARARCGAWRLLPGALVMCELPRGAWPGPHHHRAPARRRWQVSVRWCVDRRPPRCSRCASHLTQRRRRQGASARRGHAGMDDGREAQRPGHAAQREHALTGLAADGGLVGADVHPARMLRRRLSAAAPPSWLKRRAAPCRTA